MAYGDPIDPTDPTAGYGGGGLLGGALNNPLFNFGVGLLSTVGQSTDPSQVSGVGNIGKAFAYASTAQQEALKNQLIRQKLAESAKEAAASKAFQDAIASGGVTLPPNADPKIFAAAAAADPGAAAKAYIGALFPDAVTQSTIALNNAQLLKLQREGTGETGDVLSQTTKAFGNVKSIGEISQRLENSPLFAPGGAVDQFGMGPTVAGGLKMAKAAGVPVDQKLIDQATDLSILDKATISMATNLQTVSSNLPRSGMAMQAIQTAVAAKMPWPAKREVLVPNMKAIFADVEEQGLQDKVPGYQDMKAITAEWERQADAYNQRRNIAEGGTPAVAGGPPVAPPAPAVAAGPPPVVTPSGVPGVATQPNMLFEPTAAPWAGAGLPPTAGAADGNVSLQPPTSPVTTTPQPGVPQKTPGAAPPMAINPRTKEQERVWPRPIDGERAIKAQQGPDAIGRTFIAINPQTGRPQLYTITENNKGALR